MLAVHANCVSGVEVDKRSVCWPSWDWQCDAAEHTGLLGCEVVSLGEWLSTFRRIVLPSKHRQLLAESDGLTVQGPVFPVTYCECRRRHPLQYDTC